MQRGTAESCEPTDNRALALVLVSVSAIALFGVLARRVARQGTASVDEKVSEAISIEPDHGVRRAAKKAAPIGKWWTYVPVAVASAAGVAALPDENRVTRRARAAGAAAIVAVALAAARLNHLLDRLPQPPAPAGRDRPDHPVFPSGHAFGTGCVALTAAYVVVRESLAPGSSAFPLALLLPVSSSIGRMIEEKHWLTDVVGGYLAAIALSAAVLSLYETARTPAARPASRP